MLLAAALAAAFVVPGLSKLSIDTGVASFVPTDDPAYEALQDRDRAFGGDPIAVVLKARGKNGLLLEQEQLLRMVRVEGELAVLDDVAVVYGPGTVLNQTAKAMQNMLLQIAGRRDALENVARELADGRGDAAVQRAVEKFDQRYGALLVRAMPMGLPTLSNPKFVANVLFGDDGEPRAQWKFLVPDRQTATVLVRPEEGLDERQSRELVSAVKDTVDDAGLDTQSVEVTGVPVLTSEVASQAKRELPLLGVIALAAVGGVFLLSPWSRRRRSRLRPLVIALVGTGLTMAAFGWIGRPLSLGAVAFLPILLGIASDFPLYLSQHAERRRILVAALAAVAAFASLAISPLPFVRELGTALAVGLVVTCVLGLGAERWLPRIEPQRPNEDGRRRFATPGLAVRGVVAVVGVVASLAGWIALPGIELEASPDQLAQGLPALEEARAVEKTIGFSGEMTVMTEGENVLSVEALRWNRAVEAQIVRDQGDQMRPIFTLSSLLQFLGNRATPEQVDAASTLVPPYLLDAVVTPDSSTAAMVFGVELDDVRAQSKLVDDVESSLPPSPAGIDAELVGLPVVAARTLELMSANRLLINVLGMLAAVLVLAVFLPQRSDALRALAAVGLATGWVFGLTSLVGSLSPLTIAAGALITVTGCEFTVVMTSAIRQSQAWLMRTSATAAAAGCVGYATLMLSELAILRDFGLLLAASVCLSYLAAFVVVRIAPPRILDDGQSAAPVEARVREEVPA